MAGRKTKRRTQATAKCYAFHANATTKTSIYIQREHKKFSYSFFEKVYFFSFY